MEHRRYMRVPADLDTRSFHCGLPVASGRIVDAGRGGVFVETTFAGVYDLQMLECEFLLAQNRVRLDAHVVRHDPRGIALWVDDTNPAATKALRSLLSACGPIPAMRLPPITETEPGSQLREFLHA